MSVRVEFRWSEGLLAAVDGVRGDVPRSVWVRRAVERALGECGETEDTGVAIRPTSASLDPVTPAPAEQPSVDTHHESPFGSPAVPAGASSRGADRPAAVQSWDRAAAFRRATQK